MLFEALADAFLDYASLVDGEIGAADGMLEVVLTAGDAVVRNSLKLDDNEAGAFALGQLVRLGAQSYGDLEYAAARALVVQRLSSYLDDTWNNDTSTVPAGAVVSIGELVVYWIGIRAYEDSSQAVELLGRIAVRAIASHRKHIGYAATGELARTFPILCNESLPSLRDVYLEAWAEASAPIMRLAPLEPIDGMSGVADALVPGITTARSPSLQYTMWNVAPANVSVAAATILDAVEPALFSLSPDVENERHREQGLEDALALVYGAALLSAHDEDRSSATELPGRICRLLLRSTSTQDGESALMHPEVAELVWSILLTVASAESDDTAIADIATSLLAASGADEGWQSPPVDQAYVLAFLIGLKVVAGLPAHEIDGWEWGWACAGPLAPPGLSAGTIDGSRAPAAC